MPTTNVKFFSSEMAGAPVISGTKGSMIAALDAVMVTGFGLKTATSVVVAGGVATVALSTGNFMQHQIILVAGATPAELNGEKRVLTVPGATSFTFDATGVANGTATGTITVKTAPLGWVKQFSGTNKAVYKIDPALHPDSTGHLVRFDEATPTNAVKFSGYEAMTDVDTGTAAFPTVSQRASGLFVFRSETTDGTARSWFIVGDSRTIYVGIHAYQTSLTNYGPCWFSFGEFKSKKLADPYRFFVSGNYPSDFCPAPDASYSCAGTAAGFTYTSRPYTGLGSSQPLVTVTWPSGYGGSGGGAAPLAYPNGPDYGLFLCAAQLTESAITYRGDWPGMLFIPQIVLAKICPDLRTGYYDTEVAGYAGKVIGFFPCSYAGSGWGVVAFDLTGPWEH